MKLDSDTVSVEDICKKMAKESKGFSGADLSNLVRSASVRCMLSSECQVTMKHFEGARKYDVIEPSSDQNLINLLKKWKP